LIAYSSHCSLSEAGYKRCRWSWSVAEGEGHSELTLLLTLQSPLSRLIQPHPLQYFRFAHHPCHRQPPRPEALLLCFVGASSFQSLWTANCCFKGVQGLATTSHYTSGFFTRLTVGATLNLSLLKMIQQGKTPLSTSTACLPVFVRVVSRDVVLRARSITMINLTRRIPAASPAGRANTKQCLQMQR
jgi:hypothetical protein